MTLDEAILHAREVAEIQRNNDKLNKTLGKSSPYYNTDCIKCAEEHEQLADWLEELKAFRENKWTDIYIKRGYNKAIDDVLKLPKYTLYDMSNEFMNIRIDAISIEDILKLKESE